MKQILAIMLLSLFALSSIAQTTSRIRKLEKERSELRNQISESETLLQSTKKDVKSQLENLALLSDQISERKRYIQTIGRDVNTIDQEVRRLSVELKGLNDNLSARKERYASSVRFLSFRLGIHEKLMFVFAADNLNQMYRRMRYMQEYASFQRLQGQQIVEKQKEVIAKKDVLNQSKKAKENLLARGKLETIELEKKEMERKNLLSHLQKQQRSIQNELQKKKRTADQLNAKIDKLIAYEIEQEKKRQEARRKMLEAKKKAQKPTPKIQHNAQKQDDGVKTETEGKQVALAKQEVYRVDTDDRRLSGTFEKNKGSLPIPVTGTYAIVGHYGQYQVNGLRHVRLDNKGIDIKTRKGAMARAVFDGEVSAIFQLNGLNNVLVRHGSYITVYCNLSSVIVRKGSLLKTRDVIGEINTDADGNTILHFQLRKEKVKLNPELWIRR